MTGKKQYYKLDDIGFVGTQDKGTPAQFKKDIERTIQYIKDLKAGKLPAKTKKTAGAEQR